MSPELRLVAACCRWPDDEPRRQGVRDASRRVSDWDLLVDLAEAHRVEGLVVHALRSAELPVPARLGDAAAALRSHSLAQLAETLRLSEHFAALGIAHRVLKGIPLGVAAYGSATIKHSWDIDLLVRPANAVEAARTLGDLGYAPLPPADAFDDAEFRRWAVASKEVIFQSPAGHVVELHWRVSDHPMLLGRIDATGEPRNIELIAGHSVPTLADPANLAYLAVHGAFHGWSRLKWLADFAALAGAMGAVEVDLARRFGVGRALDQALEMSYRLLGTSLPRRGEPDAETARLVTLATQIIALRVAGEEIESNRRASARIRACQWRLSPGIAYRAGMALRWIRGSEDRKAIALPRGLAWGYWLLRPFTASFRFLKRRLSA